MNEEPGLYNQLQTANAEVLGALGGLTGSPGVANVLSTLGYHAAPPVELFLAGKWGLNKLRGMVPKGAPQTKALGIQALGKLLR